MHGVLFLLAAAGFLAGSLSWIAGARRAYHRALAVEHRGLQAAQWRSLAAARRAQGGAGARLPRGGLHRWRAGGLRARAARRFVEATLHGWRLDILIEVVVLLAGELVTNALTHPPATAAGIGLIVLRGEEPSASQSTTAARSFPTSVTLMAGTTRPAGTLAGG